MQAPQPGSLQKKGKYKRHVHGGVERGRNHQSRRVMDSDPHNQAEHHKGGEAASGQRSNRVIEQADDHAGRAKQLHRADKGPQAWHPVPLEFCPWLCPEDGLPSIEREGQS